jgi:hypothetical protein
MLLKINDEKKNEKHKTIFVNNLYRHGAPGSREVPSWANSFSNLIFFFNFSLKRDFLLFYIFSFLQQKNTYVVVNN